MKNSIFLAVTAATLLLAGCRQNTGCNEILSALETKFNAGNFHEVARLADSLKRNCGTDIRSLSEADSLVEISERIILDFCYSENEIREKIKETAGDVNDGDIEAWEKKKWLEFRIIDGEKRYFSRAASNLALIRDFYEGRGNNRRKLISDPDLAFRLKHTEEILKTTDDTSIPSVQIGMEITFTITVQPDAVPEGEVIRCWIPWPKECHPRQGAPELLAVSDQNYVIAPDSLTHRSIYMEQAASKGVPTLFQVRYRYKSAGNYFNPLKIIALPYDTTSVLYKTYTREELPQICFSENVKRTADSVTSPSGDPVTTVRKIYLWFKENIPWTGALEYSTIPNIPEYVLNNRRGDCGMQTLLFMSMLRYKGIPVRWQSGWMVPPGSENLHDWCEVYYEGTGWVPVDVSYDLQQSDVQELRNFYHSGIDSYRLIANDGIAGSFYPEKKFMRSDPLDFQRGEVEWSGGNLYYNTWDYDMKIEYLK